MTLYQLLLNIQQKKPVNFEQVRKKLPKTIAWQTLFTPEPIGKSKHVVTVKDLVAFNLLLQQSKQPNSRESAAVLAYYSSHDVKCNSAYMLCFPANTPGLKQAHLSQAVRVLTAVAIHDNALLPMPFKRAESAILIENQDCFFAWKRLLTCYEDKIDLSQSDIYFSAGSRILNTSFATLLKGYEYIDCAFDYDLAGLETCVLLHQRKYATVQYLLPENLADYHDLFTFRPNSTKDATNMITLCKDLNMPDLAAAVSTTKCFMEQEALLIENTFNGSKT
jgi:hypothetical protein